MVGFLFFRFSVEVWQLRKSMTADQQKVKMKIQCGVCQRNPASVLCCAEEAALCTKCDARTQTANKHGRVALHSVPEPAKCDICQEKRGFFFCLEDRALLCRDCDVSIHTANTLSCNHRRYLVPGTRVHLEDVKGVPVKPIAPEVYLPVASPAASSMSQSSHSSRSSNLSSSTSTLPGPRILSKQTSNAKPSGSVCSPSPVQTFTLEMVQAAYSGKVNAQAVAEATKPTQQFSASQTPPLVSLPSMGVSSSGSMRKSSISEFLTDAVPGWRVDELLNFADCNEQFNPTDFSTSKMMEGETAVEGDYDWTADLSLFEAQMFSMHEVPQFPPPPPTLSASPKSNRVARQLQRISHIKQGSYLQDAFLVPDVRIASAPTSQSVPKRFKRDLYHMLN